MNEFEIIGLLTKNAPGSAGSLRVGVGDDCAVIEGDGWDWLVTTDALFEGVHFNFDYTTTRLLGRKSLSVNLSDIAAMGGQPLFYTVSLGVPTGFPVTFLRELYDGMEDIGKEAGATLIGGDTCMSKSGLVISVTVLGKTVKGKAILRSTAKEGDAVYVTGKFGGAALGLECLKKGMTGAKYAPFLKSYNDPKARLGFGSWLAETGVVTSMVDVSDGLIADLSHIADASNTGFEITAHLVPKPEGFSDAAGELGLDPVRLALTGGEDYELAFTVDAKKTGDFQNLLTGSKFRAVYPVTQIGVIKKDASHRVILDESGKSLEFLKTGYDHFSEG